MKQTIPQTWDEIEIPVGMSGIAIRITSINEFVSTIPHSIRYREAGEEPDDTSGYSVFRRSDVEPLKVSRNIWVRSNGNYSVELDLVVLP
jgi:hypothetical protein